MIIDSWTTRRPKLRIPSAILLCALIASSQSLVRGQLAIESLGELRAGSNGSNPTLLGVVNDRLIFRAIGDSTTGATDTGAESWSTDGTMAGTFPLGELRAGATGSEPLFLGVAGGKLFFSAIGDSTTATDTGRELWATDGTPTGTTLLGELRAGATGSNPTLLGVVNDRLIFRAIGDSTTGATDTGAEAWSTDGTAAGTIPLGELRAGATGSEPLFLGVAGGKLFFSAIGDSNTATDTGRELWATDGTPTGTTLLGELRAGATGSNPTLLGIVNDRLIFRAVGDSTTGATDTGAEAWSTDGTAAGTIPLGELRAGATGSEPLFLGVAGGKLFFSAIGDSTTATDTGRELWATDGTPTGTTLLGELRAGANGSNPTLLGVVNDRLIFRAVGDSTTGATDTGAESWSTDGTVAGTMSLGELRAGATGSEPLFLGVAGGKLFFSAIGDSTTATDTGRELWATDGTPAGTQLLGELRAGSNGSNPTLLGVANNRLIFRAVGDSTTGATDTGAEAWSVTSVDSDFDGSGAVDGADLTLWRGAFGATGSATLAQGDADGDRDVDGADFLAWQRQLMILAPAADASHAVPEPAAAMILLLAVCGCIAGQRARLDVLAGLS
jgi:ELWxxDGT repeat protein